MPYNMDGNPADNSPDQKSLPKVNHNSSSTESATPASSSSTFSPPSDSLSSPTSKMSPTKQGEKLQVLVDGPDGFVYIPHVPSNHRLVDDLSAVLVEDEDDRGIVDIDTSALAKLSLGCLEDQNMFEKVGFGNDYLLNPVHWDEASNEERKMYYHLYCFLCLTSYHRKDYYFVDKFNGQTILATPTVPPTRGLAVAIKEELCRMEILMEDFNDKVVAMSEVCITTLTNMLDAPMPFEWIDWGLRMAYSKMWAWMKMTRIQRVTAIFGECNNNVFMDTAAISKNALAFLRGNSLCVKEFAEKVIKFPRSNVSQMLHQPVPWDKCKDMQKGIFKAIKIWLRTDKATRLGQFTKRIKPRLKRNHEQPCSDPPRQSLLKKPALTSTAPESMSVVFDRVMDSIDEFGVNESKVTDENRSPESSLSKNTLREIASDQLKEIYQSFGDDIDKISPPLDTYEICERISAEVKFGKLTNCGIGRVLNLDRHYVSNIINRPSSWQESTSQQKLAYAVLDVWYQNHGTPIKELLSSCKPNSGHERSSRPLSVLAKKNHIDKDPTTVHQDIVGDPMEIETPTGDGPNAATTDGPTRSSERKRTANKFSQTQRDYLSQCYMKNPMPNTDEKKEMSFHTGVPYRSVTIYFMNRRAKDKKAREARARLLVDSPEVNSAINESKQS